MLEASPQRDDLCRIEGKREASEGRTSWIGVVNRVDHFDLGLPGNRWVIRPDRLTIGWSRAPQAMNYARRHRRGRIGNYADVSEVVLVSVS